MKLLYYREGPYEAARWGRLIFAARGRGNHFLILGPFAYLSNAYGRVYSLNLGFIRLNFCIKED